MRVGNVILAELDKLRTLPAVLLTAVATVGAAAGIAAAFAAGDGGPGAAESVTDVTLRMMPYVQAGLVLLGSLPAAHEYADGQIRATLTAVPERGLLVAAKSVAAATAVTLTAAAATGAGAAAAALTWWRAGAPPAAGGGGGGALLGATAYLALIGLLSYAVALLVRHLIPVLVGVLSLVLIGSPLLAAVTAHARWLPDRAGSQLYAPTDPVLTAATGGLVLLVWTVAVGVGAWVRFVRADP